VAPARGPVTEVQQGRYLFAVARGLPEGALHGHVGLGGATLDVVDHRGLQAVVCTVDLDEYGEEALARNLEDLGWLEKVARTHDEVVRVVAEQATVAPMRLVTICSDDSSVRTRVDDHHDGMVGALDNVEGRREWSVKVLVPPRAPEEPEETARPTSGAAYLMRKREQAARRRSAGEDAAALAERVHDALAGAAVASRRLPPQDPRLTGRTETMVLNAAYLVPETDHQAFLDLVARVREQEPEGIIEAGGPWPPYSFAVME
jgi:hypothetical protein